MVPRKLNRPLTRASTAPRVGGAVSSSVTPPRAQNRGTRRQRHHARFWDSGYRTAQAQVIYVGTASYDNGLKWGVTHSIDPTSVLVT